MTEDNPTNVFVTDFDGTMTQQDFYQLTIESLLPADTPNHWIDYRSGAITHFEALRRYFAEIRATEREVLAVVDRMGLDPRIPESLKALRNAGWRVVVVSAGCDWYIRRHLAAVLKEVEIHSNPGRFVEGQGLLMSMPVDSPFLSQNLGVDKAGVVRHHLEQGRRVAFAGDGFPDVEPARLVPESLRFARGDLAATFRSEGLPFRPFDHWSDVADILLRGA